MPSKHSMENPVGDWSLPLYAKPGMSIVLLENNQMGMHLAD